MGFWIAAGVAALAAALWVARPLALGRRAARSRAAHDEQVFRDQLAEVDRDLDRGVLNPTEAEAARIEISRRLLGAADERARSADHQPAPLWASLALAAVVVVGAPGFAYFLYGGIGAPGLPDQPLASRDESRPPQQVAEVRAPEAPPMPDMADADTVALVDRLTAQLEGPDADRQGLYLLAQAQGRLGRFRESWRTYARLIEATGGDAPGGVFAAMAEAMILATAGYISPEAEAALTQALQRDPQSPIARYYMGSAFAQTGRPASAMETWGGLLADSPPDAPWVQPVRARIADLAAETGVAPPDGVEVAAAPGGDVLQLTRGLDERLRAESGPPEAWAQLVRSYAALGMREDSLAAAQRARGALQGEALTRFEGMLDTEVAMPGPSAEDVAAAADMDPGDRQAMIRGMVEGLRDRLYDEGGSVDEWARLIRALGVLGETDGVVEAYERGAQDHAADASAIGFLRERALVAGAVIE